VPLLIVCVSHKEYLVDFYNPLTSIITYGYSESINKFVNLSAITNTWQGCNVYLNKNTILENIGIIVMNSCWFIVCLQLMCSHAPLSSLIVLPQHFIKIIILCSSDELVDQLLLSLVKAFINNFCTLLCRFSSSSTSLYFVNRLVRQWLSFRPNAILTSQVWDSSIIRESAIF